ncbi:MAG TPA: T9SS type A sorting domain-containing protein, partial [Ferruginibacter sp.]|nr:T9SS type A sorting domain-containing protein [Ferruginibacter sp.]
DANNNGIIDGFVDVNGDGLHDGYINGTALLMTGVDGNADGRADSWPNKNLDRDLRPNAYDMDSDGDGIVDVIEAGLPDANLNGIVDGVIAANGWSTSVSGLAALNLPNTDSNGNPNYLDIDSDDDGIPDNIEGMSTAGYLIPSTADADGDGLVNTYDATVGFGGSGIFVYDHDGDGTPDYRDLDTDGDGQPDAVEGNDFNLNGLADDNVTLTGVDTDGDGLDNRFDSLNSVINVKGTSYMMGNGGSLAGDATPGARCPVQKKTVAQINRDWRFVGTVLPVEFLQLTGVLQSGIVKLNWNVIASKEVERFEVERSTDNSNYSKTGTVNGPVLLNQQQGFSFNDDVSAISKEIVYYRIKVIGKAGEIQYSNVLVIRMKQTKTKLSIVPNPAKDHVMISFVAEKDAEITIRLIDNAGKTMQLRKQKIQRGANTLQFSGLEKYSTGVYMLQVLINDEVVTEKLVLAK